MEEKASRSLYGGSLIVPSVQELAKKHIITIPPRYIQPHHHHHQQDQVIFNSDAEIPFIDMHKLLSQDSIDSESELAKLHFACKEWGFFQLVNHGVSSSLMEKIKTEVQDFFNLPMEEKKKLWQTPGDVEGFGQAFVVSEDQKLDWADLFFMTTLPVQIRRPRLFPNLPSPFRETLDDYSLELRNLAMTILSQMETALQMEDKEVTKLYEDGMQQMRMNYYPPCPHPGKVIGLTPHSDSVGLTILLQVNEMDGLQVKKDGIWVPVKPLPDAFIVNVGDILEIQTNGVYRSIEHRATVNSVKERLSIATFYNPEFGAEIGPAPSLVTEQTPAAYTRVGLEDYFKAFFERKLQGKSFLDELKIKETLGVYSLELKNLALTILSQMETALQMEAKELTKLFEDGMQSMRMNYYPPCPLPAEVIGLTPHSDSVGLTILLQVNEMDGLQVKKDGIWVPVKPLPDAFIVNIGDILEIQTNGIYRSIEHRATVNSVKERLSIATFHNPALDGEIGPASSLVTEQTPAVYKRVEVQDYVKALFERKLQGKSFLDELRIK